MGQLNQALGSQGKKAVCIYTGKPKVQKSDGGEQGSYQLWSAGGKKAKGSGGKLSLRGSTQ